MSDNKLVKRIIATATATGFAVGISWVAKKVVLKRELHHRPQQQCDKLREVHHRHGGQRCTQTAPRGPKDSSPLVTENTKLKNGL